VLRDHQQTAKPPASSAYTTAARTLLHPSGSVHARCIEHLLVADELAGRNPHPPPTAPATCAYRIHANTTRFSRREISHRTGLVPKAGGHQPANSVLLTSTPTKNLASPGKGPRPKSSHGCPDPVYEAISAGSGRLTPLVIGVALHSMKAITRTATPTAHIFNRPTTPRSSRRDGGFCSLLELQRPTGMAEPTVHRTTRNTDAPPSMRHPGLLPRHQQPHPTRLDRTTYDHGRTHWIHPKFIAPPTAPAQHPQRLSNTGHLERPWARSRTS